MHRVETFGGAIMVLGDAAPLMRKYISPDSVDLIFCDPPYGTSNLDGDFLARINDEHRANEAANIEIEGDSMAGALDLVEQLLGVAGHGNVLKKTSALCIMAGGGGSGILWATLADLMNAPAYNLAFDHAVIWDKRNPGMGRRYRRGYEFVMVGHRADGQMSWYRGKYVARPNIVSMAAPRKREHPNEKPVGLALEFILNHSPVGGLVVDPFAGSGSTGVAALRAGRRFIGIESEERWFDLACRRLAEEARAPRLDNGVPTQMAIEEAVTS